MESTNYFDIKAAGTITRLPISAIAKRLAIGKMAVYEMLEAGILPGIRLGRRWIVTRQAFEHWERTCGLAVKAIA